MPRIRKALTLFMVLSVLGTATLHAEQVYVAPQFTWSSFLRFWNKNATPLVRLEDSVLSEGSYLTDFGHTTTVRVHTHKQKVTGVSVRFVGGGDNDAGGPQFLRLIYQCITVGTYQWPAEKIQEAREAFRIMSPAFTEYAWRYSRFSRSYAPGGGWEFRMDYTQK